MATNSVHLPGHPYCDAYTPVDPAQDPQISMFAMMLWLVKCEPMSQSVDGKSASAVPQLDGSGVEVSLLMSEGIDVRGKNQVRIPASRSSIA